MLDHNNSLISPLRGSWRASQMDYFFLFFQCESQAWHPFQAQWLLDMAAPVSCSLSATYPWGKKDMFICPATSWLNNVTKINWISNPCSLLTPESPTQETFWLSRKPWNPRGLWPWDGCTDLMSAWIRTPGTLTQLPSHNTKTCGSSGLQARPCFQTN